MVGLLLIGVFLAVVFAYGCTEYILSRFDARRRVLAGESMFRLIVVSNIASFAVLWLTSLIFVLASGSRLYLQATVVCVFAQAVWLAQHLWFYYRDHVRLRDNWSASRAAE